MIDNTSSSSSLGSVLENNVPGSSVAPAAASPGTPSSPPAPESSPAPTPDCAPAFPRLSGETPRAYTAFMAYFGLGHARSLQAVCDQLEEGLSTVKIWSARHRWQQRIQTCNSGLLEQHARSQAALEKKRAADWAERLGALREQEWDAAQKLLSAAQCFLESFGDDALSKMTLAQVSRAVSISSRIGRSALVGVELPPSPEQALAPIQIEFMQALERAYGHMGETGATSATGKDAVPGVQSGPATQLCPKI